MGKIWSYCKQINNENDILACALQSTSHTVGNKGLKSIIQ